MPLSSSLIGSVWGQTGAIRNPIASRSSGATRTVPSQGGAGRAGAGSPSGRGAPEVPGDPLLQHRQGGPELLLAERRAEAGQGQGQDEGRDFQGTGPLLPGCPAARGVRAPRRRGGFARGMGVAPNLFRRGRGPARHDQLPWIGWDDMILFSIVDIFGGFAHAVRSSIGPRRPPWPSRDSSRAGPGRGLVDGRAGPGVGEGPGRASSGAGDFGGRGGRPGGCAEGSPGGGRGRGPGARGDEGATPETSGPHPNPRRRRRSRSRPATQGTRTGRIPGVIVGGPARMGGRGDARDRRVRGPWDGRRPGQEGGQQEGQVGNRPESCEQGRRTRRWGEEASGRGSPLMVRSNGQSWRARSRIFPDPPAFGGRQPPDPGVK